MIVRIGGQRGRCRAGQDQNVVRFQSVHLAEQCVKGIGWDVRPCTVELGFALGGDFDIQPSHAVGDIHKVGVQTNFAQQGGEQRTSVTGGKAQRTHWDTQTGQHDRDIDTLSAGQQLGVLHAMQGTRMQGG